MCVCLPDHHDCTPSTRERLCVDSVSLRLGGKLADLEVWLVSGFSTEPLLLFGSLALPCAWQDQVVCAEVVGTPTGRH